MSKELVKLKNDLPEAYATKQRQSTLFPTAKEG
jgi:hypothetical protein